MHKILKSSLLLWAASPDLSISRLSLSLRCHVYGPLAKHLMHMVHLSGNASGVSKSSSDWLNYTNYISWDVCVVFFNVLPGNKDAVTPNSLMKEESRRVYNCDDEHLSESTKRWIFKTVWNISSLRHRIFQIHSRGCYCGDISTPWNVTLQETYCYWLDSWAGLGQWMRPSIPDLQPSVRLLKYPWTELTSEQFWTRGNVLLWWCV